MEDCSVGNVHPCWSKVDNTVMDVRRAVIKARILTGTYYLQADRDQFQKKGIASMCPLCSATSEDRLHFLTACASLAQIRQPLSGLAVERTGAVVKPRTLGREVPGSSPPVAICCGLEQVTYP